MSELPAFSTITMQQQGLGPRPWYGRLFASEVILEAWADSPAELLAYLERLWRESQHAA